MESIGLPNIITDNIQLIGAVLLVAGVYAVSRLVSAHLRGKKRDQE